MPQFQCTKCWTALLPMLALSLMLTRRPSKLALMVLMTFNLMTLMQKLALALLLMLTR